MLLSRRHNNCSFLWSDILYLGAIWIDDIFSVARRTSTIDGDSEELLSGDSDFLAEDITVWADGRVKLLAAWNSTSYGIWFKSKS
jgi:hypothetical protein